MKVSHTLSENLTICFEKTSSEFHIHFFKSEKEPEKSGSISGKDLGTLLEHLKRIYQMYRAWYKFKVKK